MSNKAQRSRDSEDLEAAKSLLILSKNPRMFGMFPAATEADTALTEQDNSHEPQLVHLVRPIPPQDAVETRPMQGNGREDCPRESVSGEQALQAYLIRQQIIAGIPPEQMTRMDRRRNQGQASSPALIQITNDGMRFPAIPPAQFNGVFHPLPVQPPEFSGGPTGAAGMACPNVQSENRTE